jgi:hypothetical protein
MLAVDEAMLATMETGLDEINTVLVAAVTWPVPGDPDTLVARVPVAQLVESTASASGLDVHRLIAAVRWLTLTPNLIASEGLRYWSLEGRNARLALRPLIQVPGTRSEPDTVLILPSRTFGTRHLVTNYLNNSRLPWPNGTLLPAVIAAQRKWRQVVDRADTAPRAVAASSQSTFSSPQGMTPRCSCVYVQDRPETL